jgi:hypothetical protein
MMGGLVEGAGQAPLTLSEGQSLLAFAESLIAEAQRRHSVEGLPALDDRTVRLIREILDPVRVGPQMVYLARYPVETCPPLVDGQPEHEFVPVIMRTETLALQDDSVSDEEFTRRARETILEFMQGASSFFVYRIIVYPVVGTNAQAWCLRYARLPK